MINKRDLAVLQFIAVAVIFFTASWPRVRQFFSHAFPYAEVVIPAGAFVLLFQALSFIYTHHLWKLHPGTTYLGGQWIYRTEKQTAFDPASSDVRSEWFYGVFEVIHTADKLLVNHGKAWHCNEEDPSFENTTVIWNSSAIVYRDNMLWIVGDIASDDPSRPRLAQLAVLTVSRRESEIAMDGTIWGIADLDGEYAYGFTETKKISNRPRKDAAQIAHRKYGLS